MVRGPADLAGFEDENAKIVFRNPEQEHKYADEASNLTPAQRRRIHEDADKWEAELGQQHADRISARGATISQEAARHSERIAKGRREVADVLTKVKSGRMSWQEGKRKLRALSEQHRDALRSQDVLVRQTENWNASIERDPAEAASARHDRFKALGEPGRALTSAVIRGEVDR